VENQTFPDKDIKATLTTGVHESF